MPLPVGVESSTRPGRMALNRGDSDAALLEVRGGDRWACFTANGQYRLFQQKQPDFPGSILQQYHYSPGIEDALRALRGQRRFLGPRPDHRGWRDRSGHHWVGYCDQPLISADRRGRLWSVPFLLAASRTL